MSPLSVQSHLRLKYIHHDSGFTTRTDLGTGVGLDTEPLPSKSSAILTSDESEQINEPAKNKNEQRTNDTQRKFSFSFGVFTVRKNQRDIASHFSYYLIFTY